MNGEKRVIKKVAPVSAKPSGKDDVILYSIFQKLFIAELRSGKEKSASYLV
jgi:hypothetical protein